MFFMISCGVVFLHRISHLISYNIITLLIYIYICVNLFTLKYRPLHPHITPGLRNPWRTVKRYPLAVFSELFQVFHQGLFT